MVVIQRVIIDETFRRMERQEARLRSGKDWARRRASYESRASTHRIDLVVANAKSSSAEFRLPDGERDEFRYYCASGVNVGNDPAASVWIKHGRHPAELRCLLPAAASSLALERTPLPRNRSQPEPASQGATTRAASEKRSDTSRWKIVDEA